MGERREKKERRNEKTLMKILHWRSRVAQRRNVESGMEINEKRGPKSAEANRK